MSARATIDRAWKYRHDYFRDHARYPDTFEVTHAERYEMLVELDGPAEILGVFNSSLGTDHETIFGMDLVVTPPCPTTWWDERRKQQVRDHALGRVPLLPNFVVDTWLHEGIRHRRRASGAVEVRLGDDWLPCNVPSHNTVRIR